MCIITFIGQSKQYIGKRIDNHKYDLSKKTQNVNIFTTVLVDHCKKTGHILGFTNVS